MQGGVNTNCKVEEKDHDSSSDSETIKHNQRHSKLTLLLNTLLKNPFSYKTSMNVTILTLLLKKPGLTQMKRSYLP